MEIEKTRKMSNPFAESVMKRDGIHQPVAKKAKVSSLPNVVSIQSTRQYSFTMADLQKCLYNASTVHPVNAQEAIGKRDGTACFWCDASSTNPNFNCPHHEHDKSATRQMTQIPLAHTSLPPEVGLCASSIPGTGYGICVKRAIPVGAWIGPYEGTFMKPEEVSSVTDTSYMWEIFNDGKLAGFVDGSDEMVSSWMRFIRCARHRGEQNLFAFQYHGKVYYRSFKIILPGQEMLVWYDDKYPQYLGVPSTIFDMGALTAEGTANRPETSGTVLSEERHRTTPSETLTQNQFPPTPPSSVPSPSSPHSPNSQPMSHQQHSPTRPISGEPFNGFQSEVPSAFDFSSPVTSPGKPQHPILKENLTANQSHPLSLESERSDPGSPISSDDGQDNTAKQNQPVFSQITELSLWKCGQCKKSFPQRTMLQVHVCNESPQKPYQCGHCSKSFSHPAQLRAHAVIHASKKPFKCGYCSRAFAGATTLNNHIRTHTGERPFVCDKCGKNFTQGSQLSRHQRIPGDCVVRAYK